MTVPLPLVIATGNPDKAREIIEVLVDLLDEPLAAWAMTSGADTFGYLLDAPGTIAETVQRQRTPAEPPDVAETGATLEENARIKARALADAVGVLAVADDTGLHVDALGGAPGVHTARYAGPHASYAQNVDRLLASLASTGDRRAHFATVAIARWPDGREITARGEAHGQILSERLGTDGFGYDPVFVPDEGDGRTFAEMSPAEKHALSHRGRAFRALAVQLAKEAS
jgi:XTP/dITP diphosphohydrolase